MVIAKKGGYFDHCLASGFTRVQSERRVGDRTLLDVVADRFRVGSVEKVRVVEAIELAGRLRVGLKMNIPWLVVNQLYPDRCKRAGAAAPIAVRPSAR